MSNDFLKRAGDIVIDDLSIYTRGGESVSLTDYLVELNLYESIFTPYITGNIVLSDSKNLLKNIPILGEELIYVKVRTPGIDSEIFKVFRVCGLDSKTYVKDGNTQVYILQLSSAEGFKDTLNPIFKSFSGKPAKIVNDIFTTYLSSNKSELTIVNEPSNILKFVSPGWSPIKCINWICGNSEASNSKSSTFLFWETTKGFYFGNIDSLVNLSHRYSAGPYYYSSAKVAGNALSPEKEMFTIKDIKFLDIFDLLKNRMDGYLASTVIDVNLFNKEYENYEYDHITSFGNYDHTLKDDSLPSYSTSTLRNPLSFIELNYNYPNLYTNARDNYLERKKYFAGNRRSNILELTNIDVEITIPGRTDLECGTFINMVLPEVNPQYSEDIAGGNNTDSLYSGKYLITNLNHKITLVSHVISASVTKDCFSSKEFFK